MNLKNYPILRNKKITLFFFLAISFCTLTAFNFHKFYIAIYQIEYAQEKKMIQITSRIFIDDINDVLEKKYQKKTHIGDKNQSADDVVLMNKYISENFSIKVNGQSKPFQYVSSEVESNIIVGYYKITDVSKIKTLEVKNTILMDLFPEQQNIIQSKIYGKKQSLLLTEDNVKGMLK